jgi:hypothetical protein
MIEPDENSPSRNATCQRCGRDKRKNCDGRGWLEAIGPCSDGSYITSRPCPNDNPFAGD